MAEKEEIKKYFREGLIKPGIIIYTTDYLYGLYEISPNRWRQVSYVFADKDFSVEDIDTRRALLYLIEEVSKSLVRFEKGEWRVILSEAEIDEIIDKYV
ncbi:MAG: hypothetical protein ACTSVA_04745 [Candidatus Njordarchaeales archaeon]|mgnify:CR=1 FL=1